MAISPNQALWWSLPLVAAGLCYAVHLMGDLFGDELISYEWATKGTALLETGKPPTLLNIDIMLNRLAIWVFGAPWALRIPSFIFGLLSVFMVGRLAGFLAGRPVARTSMWVAALSPILVEFSAEGRPYTIYCFFGTALVYFTWRFLECENLRTALPLALSAVLGCLSRTLFVANLAFAALLYLARRKRLTRHAMLVALLVLPFVVRIYLVSEHYAAYAPKTVPGEESLSLGNFIARSACALNFGLNLFQLPHLGLARNVPVLQVLAHNGLVTALAALALAGLAAGFVTIPRAQRSAALWLAAACLVPAAVLILLGTTGYSIMREKYLIGILGPYCVLLALIFNHLARRPWGQCAIACFLLVTGISLEHYLLQPEIYSRRAFMGELDRELEKDVSEKDVAVAYHLVRRTPWYFGFFDRTDRSHFDLYQDAVLKGSRLADFAEAIDRNCAGRIYLVCDEGSRLWLDRRGDVLRVFGQFRSVRTRSYGRNLILYVFGPRLRDWTPGS